MNECRAILK